MKKICVVLCALLLLSALAGCRSNMQDTTGGTPPISTPGTTQPSGTTDSNNGAEATGSVGILESIWNLYGEDERFAVYGGAVTGAVDNAPGSLNMADTEELTSKYLVPQAQLENLRDGASLVHMMNGNIFTAAVFRLNEGADAAALAKAWRNAIGQNQWICGQPDKLLMLELDGYILMAFGSTDAMDLFESKSAAAFPAAKTLYQEAVIG